MPFPDSQMKYLTVANTVPEDYDLGPMLVFFFVTENIMLESQSEEYFQSCQGMLKGEVSLYC
jgi:hypothetical protein